MTTDAPQRLDSRHLTPLGSPGRVAIRHLRQRPLARICFLILTAYFVLALASYLRWPGEGRFIGERFETLATKRLVGPDGINLEYVSPTIGRPDLSTLRHRSYAPDDRAFWETAPGELPEPAGPIDFLFGTDLQGRSVLWRALYGTRMSMTIALGAALLAIFIGTTLGAIAGYFGGLADTVITGLFTTVASVPRILLVLAAAYAFRGKEIDLFGLLEEPWRMTGPGMLIMAMGLTSWVGLCRVIRAEVLKQRALDYESAARALGVGRWRILLRHLLPNAFYLVIIQFSLLFPLFVHLEVILSYLGLGATSGVSWGQMIQASLQEMMRTPVVWWQLATATVAVFGISLALNLFGDALRDALDPRLQDTPA
jgi:peptide/nickel transport system permease protein